MCSEKLWGYKKYETAINRIQKPYTKRHINYLTDLEREFQAEYGSPYGSDTPEEPNQKQRREALELQALAAQKKHGITIENVFTAESLEQKHAPQEAEDVWMRGSHQATSR